MSDELTFITEDNMGRLDRWLAEQMPEESRSTIGKWIDAGAVTLADGTVPKRKETFPAGTVIKVSPPPAPDVTLRPQDIPLDIVYEDDDIIVVNKPQGMVVHPAPGHPDGTLVNALLAHFPLSSGDDDRPGLVHRIDKDTSGLLVVAKNQRAHDRLATQIAAHDAGRVYRAVVYGVPEMKEGTIRGPIGRDPVNRQRMAVVPGGKPAVTHYRVLEEFNGYSYLSVALETGRTHQIRVHMKTIGHPVAGDPVYAPGRSEPDLEGQALHAAELTLEHPTTGEMMHFEAPLPEYFEQFLEKLRQR